MTTTELEKWNKYLETESYLGGFQPSDLDFRCASAL